jgi:hypothetical protein
MLRPSFACALLGVALLAGGCGSTGFTVASPTVDATYSCPPGSANARYDVHAKVPADNSTSGKVDVKSIHAVMVVTGVHGQWQEAVGTRYDAGDVQFSPSSVGANAKATLNVTIPSACSDPAHHGVSDNYADYSVQLTIVTASGTFHVTSTNKHRILAP